MAKVGFIPRALGIAATHRPRAVTLNQAAWALLVGVSYLVGAKLGFVFTSQPQPVSTLWLPNAILLATLILAPVSSWWLFLVSVFGAHLLVQLGSGIPVPMVLSWFFSNSLEALIGAACYRRFSERRGRLDSFANVGVLVSAAIFATLVTSFVDAGLVALNGYGDASFWANWRIRSMSNVLASLIVVPVILAMHTNRLPDLTAIPFGRYIEAFTLAAALLAVSLKVFGWQIAGPHSVPALMYAPLPLLLWAAVRFGPAGSSLSVFFVVVVAIWNASHGRGPFQSSSATVNALSIQWLFIVVSITLMSLAAVIADRHRTQDEMQQKREQLQLAMDAAQMGTWDWRLPGEIAIWSQESRRILGLDSADARISLEQLMAVIMPADRNGFWRAVSRSMRSGNPLETEFRVVRTDRSVRWMLSQGKVLFDASGRPTRMVGIIADVTDRKSSEALRSQENQILEMIASGAPLRDTLLSLVELIEAESPGLMCAIMLLDPDGQHVRPYVGPSLPEEYLRSIDGARIGPRAGSCGTAIYHRRPVICDDIERDPLWEDYREATLRYGLRACWSTPFIAENGVVMGSFAMYRREPRSPTPAEQRIIDTATQLVTIALERKRAEIDALEQRRALTHLGRVAILGELTGSLVHELTQPLTAMLSNAQAAQRMLTLEPPRIVEVRNILADIASANRRAGEVIHRLRAMLTKGQAQMALLSLNDVVGEILTLQRGDLVAREVQVITRLAPALPLVNGDRVQLQQVLLNLTINACDAMSAISPHERRLIIETAVGGDGNSVQLAIRDRGTGIQEGVVERIFEPFFTSKEHGLGLGLSICRSIALAHRGRLWASNNTDRGATFYLALPAAPRLDDPSNDSDPRQIAKRMLSV